MLLTDISGILQDNQFYWCVGKTTHGSYSLLFDEFNEYRTKSGELWVYRLINRLISNDKVGDTMNINVDMVLLAFVLAGFWSAVALVARWFW